MTIKEIALKIAEEAHDGQFDKAGKPYIDHPKYVASAFNDDERYIVALLHDVIEDSNFDAIQLIHRGIPLEIVESVEILTKSKGEDYFKYLERIKQNSIAKDVKLEDLKHNMDLNRILSLSDQDHERLKKYQKAYKYLTN
jgi:(p)ppGpp synthase/HD superfamily hydrolase